MTSRKCALGDVKTVQGVNGETFIAVVGSREAKRLTPDECADAAEVLLATAREAREAVPVPVQDQLWQGEAAA